MRTLVLYLLSVFTTIAILLPFTFPGQAPLVVYGISFVLLLPLIGFIISSKIKSDKSKNPL